MKNKLINKLRRGKPTNLHFIQEHMKCGEQIDQLFFFVTRGRKWQHKNRIIAEKHEQCRGSVFGFRGWWFIAMSGQVSGHDLLHWQRTCVKYWKRFAIPETSRNHVLNAKKHAQNTIYHLLNKYDM